MAILTQEQINNYKRMGIPIPAGTTVYGQSPTPRPSTPVAPKANTTTPKANTTTPKANTPSSGSSFSSNSSAIAQVAAMQAQLADIQAQQEALKRYGLTDTNQLMKSGNTYVPTPQTQAQLDQINRLKSQIVQVGGTPSAGSSSGSITAMQAQLADLQAQQEALKRYGLTDTNQLMKSGNTYVPTPEAQAQLDRNAVFNKLLPEGIGDQSIYQFKDEAFKTLIPQLVPGTPEYEAAMDAIDTSFYDILKSQMTAQTQQEQQIANTRYKELQDYLKNNLGITLSNNAIRGWEELQGIRNAAAGQGLTGSGIEAESIDDYLRKVRSMDAASRGENAYKAKGEKQNYYLNYATPAEIKALADSDPETAKAWGLIPSDEIKNSMTPAALKAKYPNMSDEDIARNISMILDENGNYRSSLYQNYMTGKSMGIDPGRIDPSSIQYDPMAQDAFGNPIPFSVRYQPTDTGILDIEAANLTNKATNVANQGAIAAWNAAEAAGVNPINKSNNPNTNNQFLTHQSTPSNIDTNAINKAVSNIQGNTYGSNTPVAPKTINTPPINNSTIDTDAISRAISNIQAKANNIASQIPSMASNTPTTIKTNTPVGSPSIPRYTGTSIVDYLKSVGKPSDYNTRSQLASQYGIKNYTGTAQQNTQLLNLMNK